MRAKYILLGIAAIIAVNGCGGAVTARGIAQVRAISAVSNPGLIDVFTDFNLVAVGLQNGGGGGYSSQTADVLSLGVRQTGTTTTIATGNLNAGVDNKYTVIPHQTGSSTVGIIALADDAATPGTTKFMFRFVHVDRNTDGVDVYFLNPDDEPADGTPIISNLDFQEATGYLELAAGTQKQVVLTEAGTTNVIGDPILLTPASGSKRTFMLFNNGGPAVNIYAD